MTSRHAARAPRIRDLRQAASLSFLRSFNARMGQLHLQAFAAGLAYGAVFALLPMLALVVFLLGAFNATGLVDDAIRELRDVLPADAMSLVETQLRSLASTEQQRSFGIGAIASVLVALWGASGAMRRVMEALTVVHGVEEGRSFLRKLAVSLLLAVGAIVLIVVTIAVIVLGGDVARDAFEFVGLGQSAGEVWSALRWPVLLVLVWSGITFAYRIAPAQRVEGGALTPGALVATLAWVLFSVAFSWYVGSIADLGAAWGAVAGVIVFLLYLQYVSLIVLAGALLDAELGAGRRRPPWRPWRTS